MFEDNIGTPITSVGEERSEDTRHDYLLSRVPQSRSLSPAQGDRNFVGVCTFRVLIQT